MDKKKLIIDKMHYIRELFSTYSVRFTFQNRALTTFITGDPTAKLLLRHQALNHFRSK